MRRIEALNKGLLENAPDAIVVINEDGRIVQINAQTETLFGYSKEELIGQELEILIPERFRDRHREQRQKFFQTPYFRPMGIGLETYGLRKEGSEFPAELSLSWYRAEEGILALSAIREVTKATPVTKALESAEKRLVLLMDTLPVLIAYVDAYQHYRMVNKNHEVWFGHARDQIQGKHLVDVLGQAAYETIEKHIRRVLSGQTVLFEQTLPFKHGGPRSIEAICVPHLEEPGQVKGFFTLISDLTERERIEEQIRYQQEEIAHLARLSTAGEMVPILVHEIKQPLTAINSYADACLYMLRLGTVPAEKLVEALEKIINQTQHANDIVRRFREFIRRTETELNLTDINRLVWDTLSLAEIAIRDSQVRLLLELGDSLPPVSIDLIQIEQVLLNLIRNGLEAMQDTEIENRELVIRTSLTSETNEIEVAVSDKGSGINPEALEQLFKPFFTTKASGMGVGLSICRSIIEAHGGRIWTTSNADQGTTFHFTLPVGEERG